MEELKEYLDSLLNIPNSAWKDLSSSLKEEELSKKAFYIKEGEVCDKIGFLKSGFLRAYYFDNSGSEKTVYFNFKQRNPVVSDFESFISKNQSKHTIQAITQCEIATISRGILYNLYEKHPSIEKLGRIVAEKHYILALDRIRDFKTEAISRYKILLEKYPELIQNVPANLIANYLEVTETSLSRIKAQIQKFSKKLP